MPNKLKPGDRVHFVNSSLNVTKYEANVLNPGFGEPVKGIVTGLLRCGNKDCVEVRVDRVDGSGQYDLYTVDLSSVSRI
jgi:hypothetical protein